MNNFTKSTKTTSGYSVNKLDSEPIIKDYKKELAFNVTINYFTFP
jgi:hypothetical protein